MLRVLMTKRGKNFFVSLQNVTLPLKGRRQKASSMQKPDCMRLTQQEKGWLSFLGSFCCKTQILSTCWMPPPGFLGVFRPSDTFQNKKGNEQTKNVKHKLFLLNSVALLKAEHSKYMCISLLLRYTPIVTPALVTIKDFILFVFPFKQQFLFKIILSLLKCAFSG